MNDQIATFLNTKYHLWIGVFIGVWLYLFLILIAPFDALPLKMIWRAKLMIGYSILLTLSYFAIIPFHKRIYKKQKHWNLTLELIITLAVFVICFLPSYFYYSSNWVLGEYTFSKFSFQLYVPTVLLILMPMLVATRWIAYKFFVKNETKPKKITLSGMYNLDVLQLPVSDLICIKSANNYVEVNYQMEGQLNKKLLRNTTKKMLLEIPELVQVHRSYLINPQHFIEWKNNKTISLSYIDVPISDKYKTTFQQFVNKYR